MTTGSSSLIRYFPLWGATFDSDGVGLFGEQVVAYIPPGQEWYLIQNSAIWWERHGGSPSYGTPPLCLVTGTPVQKYENRKSQEQFLTTQGYDAVLALRLFKAGWFLDPDLSEEIFVNPLPQGVANSRKVGPYRLFAGGTPNGVGSPYHLSINDLAASQTTPSLKKATPLTVLWELVRRYREQGINASVDIAIENFHRSYGLCISSWQRVGFLFTALDAMFGGMSIRKIGKTRLRSMFRDRVSVALQAATKTTPAVAISPVDEATWLDSEGRRIRNGIAHGNPTQVAVRAEESYNRIQTLIRVILRQYLEFSLKWTSQAMHIGRQYGATEDIGLTAAYNKILDAHACGVADAMNVLMPTNSTL